MKRKGNDEQHLVETRRATAYEEYNWWWWRADIHGVIRSKQKADQIESL